MQNLSMYLLNASSIFNVDNLSFIKNFSVYDAENKNTLYGFVYRSDNSKDWRNGSIYIYRIDGPKGKEFTNQLIVNNSKYATSAIYFLCFRYSYNCQLYNFFIWRSFPEINSIYKVIMNKRDKFIRSMDDWTDSNVVFCFEKADIITRVSCVSRIYVGYDYERKKFLLFPVKLNKD